MYFIVILKKLFSGSPPMAKQQLSNSPIPWSKDYKPFRRQHLQTVVTDQSLLAIFKDRKPLPENYGCGLDERIVEYPWVLSQLGEAPDRLLDAGSTLNYAYLLDLPTVASKQIVIMTLAPETTLKRDNVSYLYGDLRDILLRDNAFQWIVCISTLEHVGLDNTLLYTSNDDFKEDNTQDYRAVMAELRRVLAPGGRLLLTVPFGRAQNFGWMQQFDRSGIAEIVAAFGSKPLCETYFQYLPTGWVRSDDEACADCEYFDVHSAPEPAADGAAAARAVACLEFTKAS
jgi:SAM-dependent methyltransferase